MAFQAVCEVTKLAAAEAQEFTLNAADGSEVNIAVVRDEDGGWHAVSAMCTHADVPLAEGDVEGCQIECWAHSAVFDLKTGEGTLPATSPLKVYPVAIEGDNVLVDVDAQ